MLSNDLLVLLREWWKVGHQQGAVHREGWLFPGQHYLKPISTRQLYRVVVKAAQAADITKLVGHHTLRQRSAHNRADGTVNSGDQLWLGMAKAAAWRSTTHSRMEKHNNQLYFGPGRVVFAWWSRVAAGGRYG